MGRFVIFILNKGHVTLSPVFISIMITRGDEQKAVEALSFTRAHFYLLYQRYSITLHAILGDEKEGTQVLALAKSHQWTSLKEFVSDKPIFK